VGHRTPVSERPILQDAFLAFGLFIAVAVLALVISPRVPFTTSDGLAEVLVPLSAACAPLVVRRELPFLSWGLTTLVAIAALIVTGQVAPVAAVLVAVYTVAAYRAPAMSVPCAVVSAGALAPLALVEATTFNTWIAFSLSAWVGLATAIGIGMRNQRALVAAAEERAIAAEASRRNGELRAVAEERIRIARDLHDLVAHNIAVINVHAGVAGHVLTSNPSEAAVALKEVRLAAQAALFEAQGILGLLRSSEDPEPRGPVGSAADITALVERLRRGGHEIHWRVVGPVRPLPEVVEVACYRVLQEALTNAVKHGAGEISASLVYRSTSIVLEVTNTVLGVGSASEAGYGLIGMQERVANQQGTLSAKRQGQQFVVRAEIPVRLSEALA
jgi:signal transduction histidine kinase